MSYQGQTPNILLFVGDDFAFDEVNITGSGKKRAMQVHTNDGAVDIYGALPNISRLLRNGLYFSQAWAQPACSTTRASIFTGLHPWKNGVGSPPGGKLDSKRDFRTLPELLPSNYVSGLFGKWHLGKVDGYLPTNHGWVRHVGTLDGVFQGKYNKKDIDYTHWLIQDSDDKDPDYGAKDYVGTETTDYATWREVKEAAAWINAQGSRWFATIAFHSPHYPFHVPPGGDGYDPATAGDTDSDAYMFNVMAQNMDYNIGRLLGTSGVKGDPLYFEGISEYQLSNTIIFFIGDNGSDEKVALAEAKNNIYEGSVRVPIVIADGRAVMHEFKGQAITPRYLYASRLNATCPLLAHVVDLYKTIVRLVDPSVAFPDNTDSVDFSDVVTDRMFALNARTKQKRTYNFSQYYKDEATPAASPRLATIRTTGYKLNYEGSADPKQKPKWTLYQYSGGEIPGREDGEDPAAVDIFTDAIKLVKIGAGVNLNGLLNNLIAHYQSDETLKFPDPR
jgi:hypothetical protein